MALGSHLHRLDVLAPDDVDLERDGRHLGATSLQQPGSIEQRCVWQTKIETIINTRGYDLARIIKCSHTQPDSNRPRSCGPYRRLIRPIATHGKSVLEQCDGLRY